MASAGEKITFHVLFMDGLNNRVAVINPSLEIFSFDANGERVTLVESGTPMEEVENDFGRYSFTYQIPLSYDLGSRIYALMQGTDPATEFTIFVEDNADVYEDGAMGGSRNMTARFIK